MQTIIVNIFIAFGIAFLIALVLGLCLGIFQRVFAVPVDPKVQEVRSILTGGNCGGCGFAGCDEFAKAVVEGRAPANGCPAGGAERALAIAKVMGVQVEAETKICVLACHGTKECAKDKGHYSGLKSCAAAKLSVGGTKMCTFGCIGFGDCEAVCSFGALKVGEDGIPHIDYKKCTGCGKCVKACPNGLLRLIGKDGKGAFALCSNRSLDKPSIMKKCKAGCIKCGKCERSCEVGALKLVDGIPEIDYTKCTSCGKCVEGCPTHVLTLREKFI